MRPAARLGRSRTRCGERQLSCSSSPPSWPDRVIAPDERAHAALNLKPRLARETIPPGGLPIQDQATRELSDLATRAPRATQTPRDRRGHRAKRGERHAARQSRRNRRNLLHDQKRETRGHANLSRVADGEAGSFDCGGTGERRSEEHTSEI